MCTGVTYITAYFYTHVQEGTDVYGSHVYHSLLQHARSRGKRCVQESRISQLTSTRTFKREQMCTGVTYITAYFNTHVQEGRDVYRSHVYHSLLQHARSRGKRCVQESRISQLTSTRTFKREEMCTGVTYITSYFNTHVQEGTDVYGSHVYHSSTHGTQEQLSC